MINGNTILWIFSALLTTKTAATSNKNHKISRRRTKSVEIIDNGASTPLWSCWLQSNDSIVITTLKLVILCINFATVYLRWVIFARFVWSSMNSINSVVCSNNGLVSSCLSFFRYSINLIWISLLQGASLCLLDLMDSVSFISKCYQSVHQDHISLRREAASIAVLSPTLASTHCYPTPPSPIVYRPLLSSYFLHNNALFI
jgi:hypothetical protein